MNQWTEDRVVNLTQAEQKIIFLNENSLRHLWDNIKCTNIHIIGIPQKKEKEREEKRAEKICEDVIDENFANLEKKTHTPCPGIT